MLEIKFHTHAAKQIKLSGSHTGAGDDSCLQEYLCWFTVLSYVDLKTVITTVCQMLWSVAAWDSSVVVYDDMFWVSSSWPFYGLWCVSL